MNFEKEKRQAISIRLLPSTIESLKSSKGKYQTYIQDLIERNVDIEENYESLEYVASMIAHTIKESQKTETPREPYDILCDYMNWFLDSYSEFDPIHGELRHIVFNSMGGEFDPLVAYKPLYAVMEEHQDRFKAYDFTAMNENHLGIIVIRKYIMDLVWSKMVPLSEKDKDIYDDCSPFMRPDYYEMDKYFISEAAIANYLFHNIEKEFNDFIAEQYATGMSIEEIYAKNQAGEYGFSTRDLSMDIPTEFLSDKTPH